jgi:hypothetical protein
MKKTTFQFQIKFISHDYFQMYKTYQLFKSITILNTNIFMSIKVMKNRCTHIYADTKLIKNAKLVKAWVGLKLFIVLGL